MYRHRYYDDLGCGALAAIIIVMLLSYFTISALVIMLCWNAFAVPVFDAPSVTYWQSMAASILLSVVGGAFRSVAK